jgi:prevent-host-death family protein
MVANLAILAKLPDRERTMKILTAKEAKYEFGRLIDLARVEPLIVAKHGRPVVVVMAFEEFGRLKAIEEGQSPVDRPSRTPL